MTVIQLPNKWEPRHYQRGLWGYLENGGKRAVEIAHRRWGKDDVALHWAACSAFEKPATYWHMLPEYAQARKAIWNAINPHTGIRRIDEAFPEELRSNTNDHEMFIRFKNGSTWQVVGSDNYNSLVGTPPYGLVFSEWALANPAAWAYLAPILEENNGWALFITTPRGENHAHGTFNMGQQDPRWWAELQTVNETGFPLERVETARHEYHNIFGVDAGNALIEQEYFCSFSAAILGAIYGKWIKAAEDGGRIGSFPHNPDYPVHTSWDLGRSDATTIWFYQIIDGQIFVIDYFESSFMDIPGLASVLYGKEIDVKARDLKTGRISKFELGAPVKDHGHRSAYKYASLNLPHDGASKLLQANGHSVYDQLLDLRFENIRIWPAQLHADAHNSARECIGHCHFDTRTSKGVNALKNVQYEWDDEKKIFKLNPLHNWASHGADGFEIVAQSWRSPPPEKKPEDLRFPAQQTINEMVAQQRRKRLNEE